ncbi:MAG: hypothetical protein QXV93_01470 [Zestosphaera sp.]
MIFFKSDVEKFNDLMSKGFSDRNKGNLEGAVKNFLQAYEVASKSRDTSLVSKADLPLFYALFYDALIKKTPESFRKASEQCRKLDPSTELDLGLASKVYPPDLTRELELLAELASLPSFEIGKAKSMDLSVAEKYEKVANVLLAEGTRRLILEDLVGIHEPLNVIGFRLLGYAKIIRATKVEENEPGNAVEIYSEALAFLQQATPEVREFVNERITKLGKSTKCWVCHREIQGEEVNYIYLPASVNDYIKSKYYRDAPYLISDDGKIAVCRVCYTMVRDLSDKIAKYYYDLAIKEMRLMEERINARIRELQARVDLMRTTVRFERK